MAGNVANLSVKIGADLSEFNRKMAQATATMQSTGRRLRSIGRTITQGVTVPIAAAGTAAVVAAASFEQSFVEVRKTVNATESEFKALEQGIRQMATEIPVSTSRLNEIAAAAGRMGVAQENILQFTRTIADLGVASDLAGEDAATMLTRIIRNSGAANEDIDRLGSAIVALGNNMGTTESRIAQASARFAGIAANAGFATSEILALGGVVTEARRRVEGGATAMQRFVKFMNQAATEGGRDLRNLAAVARMSEEQFRTTFEQNAPQALEAFLQGLGKAADEGKSMSKILEAMDLNAEILQATLTNLAQNADRVGEATSTANTAWDQNNALTQEANLFYDTLWNQLKKTWNILREIGHQFGEVLLPAIRDAQDGLQDFLGSMKFMSKQSRLQIIELAAKIGVAGPLIFALGQLLKTVAMVTKVIFSRWAMLGIPLIAFMGLVQNVIDNTHLLEDETKSVTTQLLIFYNKIKLGMLQLAQASLKLVGLFSESIRDWAREIKGRLRSLGAKQFQDWLHPMQQEIQKTLDILSGNRTILDMMIGKQKEAEQASVSYMQSLRNLGRRFKSVADSATEFVMGKIGVKQFMDELRRARKMREWVEDLRKEISRTLAFIEGAPLSVVRGLFGTGRDDEGEDGSEGGGGGGRLPDTLKEMPPLLNQLHGLATQFANSFAQGLSRALTTSEDLKESLEGIGDVLLSSAIQKVLKFLLNLGFSALAGGPVGPLVKATGLSFGSGVFGAGGTMSLGPGRNRENRIVLQLDGRTVYETVQREQQRRNQ